MKNHELTAKSTIKMKLSTALTPQNLTSKKYKMKNEIMIYEDEKTSGALQEVVTKYLTLWESLDTVIDLSEELDLKVSLITDWKMIGVKLTHWTCSQDVSSQVLIDEKFDKL